MSTHLGSHYLHAPCAQWLLHLHNMVSISICPEASRFGQKSQLQVRSTLMNQLLNEFFVDFGSKTMYPSSDTRCSGRFVTKGCFELSFNLQSTTLTNTLDPSILQLTLLFGCYGLSTKDTNTGVIAATNIAIDRRKWTEMEDAKNKKNASDIT